MNIASIITSDLACIKLFEQFLLSYKRLNFLYKDSDTMFFSKPGWKSHAIYYHFELVDVEHDFSFNYTEETVAEIITYFDNAPFFIVDIAYGEEELLKRIFTDFRSYLMETDKQSLVLKILLTVPDIGVISLNAYAGDRGGNK